MPGTLDEKLFREVCQPPGAEELRQVAEQAGRAARAAANKPGDGGQIERTEMVNIQARPARSGGRGHGKWPPRRRAPARRRRTRPPEKPADKAAAKPGAPAKVDAGRAEATKADAARAEPVKPEAPKTAEGAPKKPEPPAIKVRLSTVTAKFRCRRVPARGRCRRSRSPRRSRPSRQQR